MPTIALSLVSTWSTIVLDGTLDAPHADHPPDPRAEECFPRNGDGVGVRPLRFISRGIPVARLVRADEGGEVDLPGGRPLQQLA
jgi:hypothetical protein